MTKRTINEKISHAFDEWCKKLPGAALCDARINDALGLSYPVGEKASTNYNDFLNDWEEVVWRDPQTNEDNVRFDDPELTIESIGKLRIMAMVANAIRRPVRDRAKAPFGPGKAGLG